MRVWRSLITPALSSSGEGERSAGCEVFRCFSNSAEFQLFMMQHSSPQHPSLFRGEGVPCVALLGKREVAG